jgi:hypothetical protein
VFENRVLRSIFGANVWKVTGGWRKLNNEEPHNLCSSQDILLLLLPVALQSLKDLGLLTYEVS